MNFTTGRQKLFNKSNKPSFLSNLGFSYSVNSRTQLSRPDSLLFNNINENIKSGVKHSIPISTSFNLFNYFNISPSLNYTERWYFKKIYKIGMII